jgi:Fe2+ transport system protein FeoA
MRGDEQAQRLVVEKPSALADQIEVVLREEGVPVRRTVAGQSIAIQAKTTTISNDGRARLMAMGVVVPAHGRLHILLNPQ